MRVKLKKRDFFLWNQAVVFKTNFSDSLLIAMLIDSQSKSIYSFVLSLWL